MRAAGEARKKGRIYAGFFYIYPARIIQNQWVMPDILSFTGSRLNRLTRPNRPNRRDRVYPLPGFSGFGLARFAGWHKARPYVPQPPKITSVLRRGGGHPLPGGWVRVWPVLRGHIKCPPTKTIPKPITGGHKARPYDCFIAAASLASS